MIKNSLLPADTFIIFNKTILTDNMKTVMDSARTEKFKGVINKEFEEFSKQMEDQKTKF